MADYINKNILAQAYVHVDRELSELTPRQVQELKSRLSQVITSRAKFFMYPDIEVVIELEPGSIKGKLTVLGAFAMAFYHGVAVYPDFKTGIKEMYQDSKRFSEYMVSESMFEFGARSGNCIRLEARVGLVGTLHNIVVAIEFLCSPSDQNDLKRRNNKLDKLLADVQRLHKVVQIPEDRVAIREGIGSLARRIPREAPRPRSGTYPPTDVALYHDLRERLLAAIRGLV